MPKYTRREGIPGNYTYYYDEPGTSERKKSTNKVTAEKRHQIASYVASARPKDAPRTTIDGYTSTAGTVLKRIGSMEEGEALSYCTDMQDKLQNVYDRRDKAIERNLEAYDRADSEMTRNGIRRETQNQQMKNEVVEGQLLAIKAINRSLKRRKD